MNAATHLITGATVGALAPNWWSAIILALLLHFLLDAIPHTDLGEPHALKVSAPVAADVLIGLFVIALFFLYTPAKTNLALGAFFGIFPDLLQISLMIFSPTRWQQAWLSKFHNFLHWFDFSRFKLKNPPSAGISLAYQIVIWLMCYLILVLNHAV